MQRKVERDEILGRVEEIGEPPGDLERELEEIVARAQGEDGVQRGDDAPARREGEEIRVAVRGQAVAWAAARGRARELLLEDVEVRVEPAL